MQRGLSGVWIVLLVMLPAGILVYAKLMQSEPKRKVVLSTTPLRVPLWLSGRIEVRASRLSLQDATGKHVATRDVQVSPADAARVSIGLVPLTSSMYLYRNTLGCCSSLESAILSGDVRASKVSGTGQRQPLS